MAMDKSAWEAHELYCPLIAETVYTKKTVLSSKIEKYRGCFRSSDLNILQGGAEYFADHSLHFADVRDKGTFIIYIIRLGHQL
ncbi:hypothetical protein PAECIP111892_01695 [Paenibacillus auburnensis]|uniref:Uncharacterized protein n=1 Tax=Paenibacillus auburnensis TaxID=2905649 RepID=A0ABN8FXT4_9BACL|nr:hypothetical protein PAECIP111892_01695 [Paenibacillus auburnensis]